MWMFPDRRRERQRCGQAVDGMRLLGFTEDSLVLRADGADRHRDTAASRMMSCWSTLFSFMAMTLALLAAHAWPKTCTSPRKVCLDREVSDGPDLRYKTSSTRKLLARQIAVLHSRCNDKIGIVRRGHDSESDDAHPVEVAGFRRQVGVGSTCPLFCADGDTTARSHRLHRASP